MKNKQCAIFEDLMALEQDKLLQPESSQAFHEHLATCDSCRAKFQAMNSEITVPNTVVEGNSIDYLKTVRQKQRKKLALTVLGLIGVMLVAGLLKMFVLGNETTSFHRMFLMNKNSVTIETKLFGSTEVFTRYRIIDHEDRREVKVYTGLASLWNKNTEMAIEIPMDKPIEIGGDILQPDGRYASQYARELYQAKTPYIGDNSKVLQILSLLPIGELSPYTIELKTDGRPFRLTIKFDKEFPSEPSTEKRLQDYSAVILCLIDNADEVVWEYPNSDKTDKMVISRDTVDMRFNSSPEIRSFAQSEYNLQRLLQLLRLNQ